MNPLASKIADSELEVMRVLWEAGDALPLSAIRVALKQRKGWDDSTVKTLLRRLCVKGVLKQEKRNVFYYLPQITLEEYGAGSAKALLDKLYHGSARNLIASLVADQLIDEPELEALRQFLQEEGT